MNKDKAILYMKQKKVLEEKITRINELGFDIVDIMKRLGEIDDVISNTKDSNGDMNKVYEDAINKLSLVDNELVKPYDQYCIMASSCLELNSMMQSVNSDNIGKFVNDVKELVNKMNCSSTIFYEKEMGLVNSIYKLAYETIKLENLYSSESILFDWFNSSDSELVMIREFLMEDIRTHCYIEFERYIEDLTRNGKDLFSKDVIGRINYYDNTELFEEVKRAYVTKVNDSQEMLENYSKSFDRKNTIENKDIPSFKEQLRNARRRMVGGVLKRTAAGVLVIGEIGASVLIGTNFGKSYEYKTITTVYDSTSDEPSSSDDFKDGVDTSIQLYVYGPWTDPNKYIKKDNYSRDVYTFPVNILEEDFVLSQSDLLDIDFDFGSFDYEKEDSEDIPSDYGYDGYKVVIVKKEKDLDVTKSVDDPKSIYLFTIGALLCFVVIDGFIYIITPNNQSLSDIVDDIERYKGFLSSELHELDNLNQKIIDYSEKTNGLNDELLTEYYSLPDFVSLDPQVVMAKESLEKSINHKKSEGNSEKRLERKLETGL